MSRLDKFSRRESAICRLRQFLLHGRAPRESLNSSTESNESIQLDLDQSFQKILDAHREKKTLKSGDNKENVQKNVEPSLEQTTTTDYKSATSSSTIYHSMNDSTLLGSCLDDTDSDISFNELERMCNKTLSDPDNTIHQYLAERRKGGESKSSDDSQNTLAFLDAIDECLGEQKIGSDEQLYDIEAPSFLWNNTLSGDVSELKFGTPAKSVRFQTNVKPISEESFCDLADVTISLDEISIVEPQTKTLPKTPLVSLDETVKIIDNSCYENVSNCKAKSKIHDSTLIENGSSSTLDGTFYVTPRHKAPKRILGEDCNLIDLDASVLSLPLPSQPPQSTCKDETIICISDDEENVTIIEDAEHSESRNTHPETIKNINSSVTDIHQPEPENPPLAEASIDSEERHEFNNTLEEVDYIMKQGMKYMAAKTNIPNATHSRNFLSPSPLSSPPTPNTVIRMPAAQKVANAVRHEENLKRDEFKRPRQFTRIPKAPSMKNIASPIAAYIKQTPVIPLTTSYKPATSNSMAPKTARGLKYDTMPKEGPLKSAKKIVSTLPKKAYISSAVKHVVDERKVQHLPGGEKIHKHLDSAKMPKVIRHQGKIKADGDNGESSSRLRYEANSSLANLSTISGDISVHVLKDARR